MPRTPRPAATTPAGTAKPDPLEHLAAVLAGCAPATAAEVAAKAGVAYSTVTPRLRGLHEAGRAEPFKADDGRTLWRPHPAPAAGTDSAPAGSDPDASDQPPTAPPAPADPDDTPDTAEAPSAIPDPAVPDQPAAPPAPAAEGAGVLGRRGKGQLAAQVLRVMQADPDATFKPAQLSKLLDGASQGAIANALHKLTADGTVRQTTDRPATFQAH